VDLVE